MLALRAFSSSVRSRALPVGSPPPDLAARVISCERRENTLPLRESVMAFARLTLDHLLWPAIGEVRIKKEESGRGAEICHSKRSEELSKISHRVSTGSKWILHFVQNDSAVLLLLLLRRDVLHRFAGEGGGVLEGHAGGRGDVARVLHAVDDELLADGEEAVDCRVEREGAGEAVAEQRHDPGHELHHFGLGIVHGRLRSEERRVG